MRSRIWPLSLLFVALSAFANPKEDAAQKRKDGERFMSEGDYDAALSAFEEAKRLAPDPSLELSLASAFIKLRRFEEAKAAYLGYLDSAKPDKQTQRKIKEAIVAIEKIEKTSLLCESEPPGATVYLDSRVDGLIGQTPITFNLPPGEHSLMFEKEGYAPKVERLSIQEGEASSLKTSLVVAPFVLEVKSEPSGAEIWIDGVSKGKTPSTLEVAAGKREVELLLSGYDPLRSTIEGVAGQKLSLSKTLASSPGKLSMQVHPARATIAIEGREEQFQGSQELSLPAGSYTIVARALGYEEKRLEVSVTGGQEVPLSVALTPNAGLFRVEAPPEATILIDGTRLEEASGLLSLPEGAHKLQVQAPNKLSYEGDFSLSLGSITTAQVELQDQPKLQPTLLRSAALGAAGVGLVFGAVALSSFAHIVGDTERAKDEDRLSRCAHAADLFYVTAAGTWIISRKLSKRASTATLDTKPEAQ